MARPRLFELLDAGVQGPVTVLIGPAGSGKTVLLSSWVATATLPGPVAWVSLDAADNDPARFWAYLLAALRRSGAAPPGGPVGSLGLPIGGPDRGFVLGLAAALAKLKEPVVVLDDLHEITNPAVLDGLAAVLRHPPASLRLLLTTRNDAPLLLAPLRVAGELTEIRAAELAFTAGEAAALLAGHGLVLPDADLAVLQAYTEGWAAGLRLAALSLQGHPDPQGFIAQFSGSSRAVADYLLEEVLGRLPEDLRAFLLHTSVVERLSGGLADALTGRADGAQTLAELERVNAFVVALDQERSWYRYHQLLAELLRAELHASAARLVPELHRRAAGWYQEHGFPVEAARHALAAGQWTQAAELLARLWRSLVLDGEMMMLGGLVDQFPASVIAADAELLAVRAARRLGAGDWGGADADLRLAEQVAADRYLDLAVACQPEPAISVAIDLTRAVVSHARGDTPAGLELLRAAQQDLQRLHGPHALTASLREWEARLLASTGRTEQAHALLQLSGNGPRSSVATLAAWAELQLAEGDPAGALATLRPCLDGSASPLFAYQTLETLLLDAVARQRLGDHDGAAASVERALRIAEPEGYRQVFWNLGVEVRALLMRQRDRGSGHPQLLAELLETQAFAAPPAAASPVEPLTDRERTVLRYLSSELSTRQIADELYVSVNTVRSHVRSVYRKLDASRRGDAVRRARHLRLL